MLASWHIIYMYIYVHIHVYIDVQINNRAVETMRQAVRFLTTVCRVGG